MKTVITVKQDGYEIVKGIDKPIVEPFETKNKTNEILNQPDHECQKLEKQIGEFAALSKNINILIFETEKKCKKAPKNKQHLKKYNEYVDQAEKYNKEISFRRIAQQALFDKTFKENLIYMEPKLGEYIISDEEADQYRADAQRLGEHELLTRDRKVIPDFKNEEFWLKHDDEWINDIIKTIGEKLPKYARLPQELSIDEWAEIHKQQDRERIKNMDPETKKTEYEKLVSEIKRSASLKKTEYEINGHSDPLEAARSWQDIHLKKLAKTYNV